jgi:hypothetical protein
MTREQQLEAALQRYGKHDDACNLAGVAVPCSCGLDALLSPAVEPLRAMNGDLVPCIEHDHGCGNPAVTNDSEGYPVCAEHEREAQGETP